MEVPGGTKWNMLFGVGIKPLFSRGSMNQCSLWLLLESLGTTFPEREIGKKPKIAEYKGSHSLRPTVPM